MRKALGFATYKHKDQRRKDDDASPYINHPISLANILCNEGQVTDDKTLPKAERKRLQIEHAAHISDKAKLADKISNLRDVATSPPPEWSLE